MGSQEICVFANKPDPSMSLGISMVQASDTRRAAATAWGSRRCAFV
jgi:hypothetical protein